MNISPGFVLFFKVFTDFNCFKIASKQFEMALNLIYTISFQ